MERERERERERDIIDRDNIVIYIRYWNFLAPHMNTKINCLPQL